jgi:hypothetical protein
VGTVLKQINHCLWVRMADGTVISGHKSYWQPVRAKPAAKDL